MRVKLIILSVVIIFTISLNILAGKDTSVSASEPNVSFVRGDSVFSWESMSFDARKEYMKKVILPTMREKFIDFDSTRFIAMNCRTCHGSGVKAGDFKMPNERLPKLHMNFEEIAHDNPHYMEFMGGTVKPQMAALLGLEPFNPENHTGSFGCQSCHMFEDLKK
ncbi:hypothetical protein BH10BAC5_BH10BAC5_11080 [soil metagenome]